MNQDNPGKKLSAWSSFGGLIGFAVTIYFFGPSGGDDGSFATRILYAGLKGFLGGGIGAGIFYSLASIIYVPRVYSKFLYFALVVILSTLALFLIENYSPDSSASSKPGPALKNYTLF